MIEDSLLSSEQIISLMHDEYGLDINEVEKIDRGSANLYLLNKDEYILKEFQSKYTPEEILKEIKIIDHLREKNIPVPEYMPTKSGNKFITVMGKVVIVQRYIKGYTIKQNEGNYEQVIESAREYGKMIKSLDTLDVDLPYQDALSWLTLEKMNKSINKYKTLINDLKEGKYYSRIKSDLEDKIQMLEHIKDNYDFSNINNLTIKNTHGDYSLQQFIYEDGKIKAIIDFASACKMPIVWELIRSYSYIDKEFDLNNFKDYVEEFMKYVPLTDDDIKYMPYIYLVQLLNSDYGYKQYIYDDRKEELLLFGFYRTKLCKYLFENALVISNELTKKHF